MSAVRMVPLSIEQVDLIDDLIAEMVRDGDPRVSLLQLIAIQWHVLDVTDLHSRRVDTLERTLVVHEGGAA